MVALTRRVWRMKPKTKTQETIVLELERNDAWNLALLLKRITHTEISANAQDASETEAIKDAIYRFQKSLAELGIAPR